MSIINPFGECQFEEIVLPPQQADKLWTLSEKETSFKWDIVSKLKAEGI